VPGLDGFALFCFLGAVMINKVGGVVAFGVATAAAVIFAIFLLALTSNRYSQSGPALDQRSDQVIPGSARAQSDHDDLRVFCTRSTRPGYRRAIGLALRQSQTTGGRAAFTRRRDTTRVKP
jgi:hypothetical protein